MATIKGDRAFLAKLKGMSAEQIGPALSKALFVTASKIAIDAQVSITEGAGSFGRHIVSLPGEPPNNDTGGLANHIDAVLEEPLRATVTSHARYSAALEYGTSKMLARPFMGPALAKNKDTLKKNVTEALKGAVRKAK